MRSRRLRLARVAPLMLAAACASPTDPPEPVVEAPPATVPAKIWFEEIASRAGIDFTFDSGHDGRYLFPEGVVGGAAMLDWDDDGDLDVYLIQCGSIVAPGRDRSRNRLFRNDGDGRFSDVTEGSGADDRGNGMGAATGDYDNDGDVDLYITNLGNDVLLRNDGGGRFTDVTAQSGTDNPSFGASAAFLDYDRDGDLDLYVVNYVNWSVESEVECYNSFGLLDYCYPNNYNAPAADRLYRNEGDGTFTDVTAEAGLFSAFGNGLGVVPGDYDGNGWIDVFVANDSMMNQMWLNQGDGTFAEEALLRGTAIDEHGRTKAGMGTLTADADDDGDLDLLVVNLKTQSDSFYRNEDGLFVDATAAVGLAVESLPLTRFGVGMVDLDNDGYLDLFEAAGGVQRVAEPLSEDPFAQPNVLLRGKPDGSLEPVPQAGTAEPLIFTSRAAVFGDVDNDGGVDILVVNRDGPVHLLRNVVEQRGHWILLRVLDEHGRDALGATVFVEIDGRSVRREVQPAYSYLAANDPRVHVGLGASPVARNVRVRWIDGTTEAFGDLEADRVVVLRRETGGG